MSIQSYCSIILIYFACFTASQSQQNLLQLLPNSPNFLKAVGDELVLTCLRTADNVTDIKWLDKNNNVISGRNSRLSLSKYPNDRGLVLTFAPLYKEDEGTYTCQAQCGAETLTQSIHVTPFVGISWENVDQEQSAIKGSNYKIRCQVRSEPAATVSWQMKDGDFVHIENDGRYVIDSEGLTIQNVQESDSGEYRCKAVIYHPLISESKSVIIHFDVIVPPSFAEQLSDQEVVEGDPANIVCKANGKPQPLVSWIRTSTQSNVTSGYTGILHIPKVSKEDDGIFKCVASNKGGEIAHSVHLKVLRKPEIIHVKNETVVVKTRGEIRCYASGYPVPKITIQKKYAPTSLVTEAPQIERKTAQNSGGPRTGMAHITVTTEDFPENNTAVANLIFNYVDKADNGLYECVAENKIGRAIENAYLGVEFPPTFENTPVIKDEVTWRQRPVNLTCIAESIPNATITWAFNNRLITSNSNYYTQFGTGPESSLQVTPLDLQIYGSYRCCARNKHGEVCENISLREAKNPGPVSNVEFESVTATTITFRFADPIYDGGLKVKAYVVQYKLDTELWREAKNKTWPKGASYILDGLIPKRTYNFRFAAANEVGMSDWGGNTEREMPERSTPNEPVIINPLAPGENYILSASDKQFELRWNLPADNGIPIDLYEVHYCVMTKTGEAYIEELPLKCETKHLPITVAPSYKITNLTPDTFYKIQLRAHNSMGLSNASVRYLKTPPGIPPGSEGALSSGVIIYVVLAVLLALLVIVDISCFVVGNTGFLYMIFRCCCRRKKKNEDKLGRSHSTVMLVPTNYVTVMRMIADADKLSVGSDNEGKDLISNGHGKKSDVEENPLMVNDGKKDTTVEYDVKKGVSKTGFVGKDSAV